MPHRSMTDRVVVKRHINGTFLSTQTPASGVDLRGLKSAEVIVDIGAVTSIAGNSWTFALQHSDAAGSGFAAVEADDVVIQQDGAALAANGVFATVDAAEEDDAIYRVGYVGTKRYVRVVATAGGTPGNTPIAVVVVGEPNLAPAT